MPVIPPVMESVFGIHGFPLIIQLFMILTVQFRHLPVQVVSFFAEFFPYDAVIAFSHGRYSVR
jgi:hypothetical protein